MQSPSDYYDAGSFSLQDGKGRFSPASGSTFVFVARLTWIISPLHIVQLVFVLHLVRN